MAGEVLLAFKESAQATLVGNTSTTLTLSKDYPFLRLVSDGVGRVSAKIEGGAGAVTQDANDSLCMPGLGSIWLRSPANGASSIKVISPVATHVWLEGWDER
jgi:hypothetical protein